MVALKMGLSSTTKVEVAVSQLRHAIELFLEDRELISAITLAGAAEEILGQLAEKDGFKHALDRRAEGARVMFKHVCGSDPGTQPFVNIKNKTRNELNHLMSGDSICLSLEREAERILDRAVENYKLLHGRAAPFIRLYEQRRRTSRRKSSQELS